MMRDEVVREIEAEYAAQRTRNHAEEARRLAQAAEADPRIAELVERRRAFFHRQAQAAFTQPEEAEAISLSLRETVLRLQEELRERLAAAGFDPHFLQPVYRCHLCRDTGFVGEPLRERCACFEKRAREKILAEPGHGLDSRETFAAYDETVYSDAPLPEGDTQRAYMERMRRRCLAYAEAFPDNPQKNLLFVGMSGLGKTFLMNCIGNHVRAKGAQVCKLTAYRLAERMRAAVFGGDGEAFAPLLAVPLLLLDDLGVEPLWSNITIEHLFTLINERGLSGLSTVVSTNLMPEELKGRYTERVCSRLFDRRATAMLLFRGGDVRLR